MELMQLEMFLAVVEERSVNRAAERVCRTQPAVSIALRKLEQECGQALLHRPRRGTYRLTPAGELMYELAIQMVGLRNEAVSSLRGAVLSMPSRVGLGVDSAENATKLLPTLSLFRRKNPTVRVELFLDTANRLLSDLVDRKIDLFLGAKAPSEVLRSEAFAGIQLSFGKGERLWMVHPKRFGCETARVLAETICPNLEVTEGMRNAIHQRKIMSTNVA